jgi:hypothetical protein
MLNNKLNGYMCELFSIGIKNEPAIKFVTDFWDNPRNYAKNMKFQELVSMSKLSVTPY